MLIDFQLPSFCKSRQESKVMACTSTTKQRSLDLNAANTVLPASRMPDVSSIACYSQSSAVVQQSAELYVGLNSPCDHVHKICGDYSKAASAGLFAELYVIVRKCLQLQQQGRGSGFLNMQSRLLQDISTGLRQYTGIQKISCCNSN